VRATVRVRAGRRRPPRNIRTGSREITARWTLRRPTVDGDVRPVDAIAATFQTPRDADGDGDAESKKMEEGVRSVRGCHRNQH
jgi:hypothetical protein